MMNKNISLNDIYVFIFDFDGVLTNNLVHLDQIGNEYVSCSRSDGLAFDVLRKLDIPTYILSTEENPVVTARANKLNITAIQGISNKALRLVQLSKEMGFDLKNVMYVGNDINDYEVMKLCGYTACPNDSHEKIKEISQIILNNKGGNGVVRELLEEVLSIDFIKILYL